MENGLTIASLEMNFQNLHYDTHASLKWKTKNSWFWSLLPASIMVEIKFHIKVWMRARKNENVQLLSSLTNNVSLFGLPAFENVSRCAILISVLSAMRERRNWNHFETGGWFTVVVTCVRRAVSQNGQRTLRLEAEWKVRRGGRNLCIVCHWTEGRLSISCQVGLTLACPCTS